MPVTPTGPISTPIDRLRTMLSESTTWQSWTGNSGDAAAAKESVYIVGALAYTDGVVYDVATIQLKRPLIIINFDISHGAEMMHDGTGVFGDGGSLSMHFEENIPAGTNNSTYLDVVVALTNNLGGVISDIAGASDDGGSLIINRVHTYKPIRRVDPKLKESLGDFHFVEIVVDYGLK